MHVGHSIGATETVARHGSLVAAAGSSHALDRTGIYSLLHQRFIEYALECAYAARDNGWTDGDGLAEAVDIALGEWDVSRVRRGPWRTWLAVRDDVQLWVEVDRDGDWTLQGAGPSEQAVEAQLDRLRAVLPSSEYSEEDDTVQVTFWAMGAMGPFSYTRRLDVTPWADASENYPRELRVDLDKLMACGPPTTGGRLLLADGPAGTGKTHLLRSLAHSWRSWASVDYIVDADQFFGQAAYMVSTMIMGADYSDRWRVLVLEDAGEFLIPDSKNRASQGLSRLLNLSDGLVGQGLRLLLFMTTNEPAEDMYPALTRPGRCMARLTFGQFDQQEATDWLRSRRCDAAVDGPRSLAELYAALGS